MQLVRGATWLTCCASRGRVSSATGVSFTKSLRGATVSVGGAVFVGIETSGALVSVAVVGATLGWLSLMECLHETPMRLRAMTVVPQRNAFTVLLIVLALLCLSAGNSAGGAALAASG